MCIHQPLHARRHSSALHFTFVSLQLDEASAGTALVTEAVEVQTTYITDQLTLSLPPSTPFVPQTPLGTFNFSRTALVLIFKAFSS